MTLIARQRKSHHWSGPNHFGAEVLKLFSFSCFLMSSIFLFVIALNYTSESLTVNSELASFNLLHENVKSDMETSPSESTVPRAESPVKQIRPPYQIAILGEPRSGSTFMHQLLYAIVRVKTPRRLSVDMIYDKLGRKGKNYVAKIHNISESDRKHGSLDRLFNEEISVFISTKDRKNDILYDANITSGATYIQEATKLRECSLCEVDAYRVPFNLSDEDIQNIKAYMGSFEILRQCCGSQMSRWEPARLHGCEITQEDKARPDYNGACASVNKTEAERIMESRPGGIEYEGLHARRNWMQAGDCARFDKKIMDGYDFNLVKFETSNEECQKLKDGTFDLEITNKPKK